MSHLIPRSGELSFFLKQVDPVLVAKKYLTNNLTMPTTKVKFDNTTLTSDLKAGTSREDEIYEIKDKNGENLRVITLEQKNWIRSNSLLNGQSSINENHAIQTYECHHCRDIFRGPYLVSPVKIEKKSSGELIIHGTGIFCCYECVYGNHKNKHYAGIYLRNYLYADTETLIRFLYNKQTGNSDLKATPDWTSRKKFDGPLPDQDYYSSKTTYTPIPNVIICTAKSMYIMGK